MTTDQWIGILNLVALVSIMLSMGMKVEIASVLASARPMRFVVQGAIANYVLFPATALVLLYLFHANPMIAIGFFILAVCPGAPVGPPMTALARGNVPFSISQMILLAGLSAVLSPALLGLMIPWLAPAAELHIDFLSIVRVLLVAQLLPLACGLGVRRWAPKVAEPLARLLGVVANVAFVILVCLIVTAQYEMLAAIRLRAWAGMTLLLLISLAIGWLCAGRDIATRNALAITTSSRNVAVGLVIATRDFANTPAVVAVVAYGLFCILGTLGFALLCAFGLAAKPRQGG